MRIFHGWVIVAAAFFIAAVVFGALYSFGVFFKPLQDEFGWARTELSGLMSLQILAYGLCCVATGSLSDKYGPRRVVTSGVIIAGLGYLIASQATAPWQAYICLSVIVGMGTSTAYIPTTSTVTRWFIEKRGLAVGIIVSGIGVGQMIMPPIATHLILEYGWRTSYLILGILVWVIAIPCSLLLQRTPHDKGLLPYGAASCEDVHTTDMQERSLGAREAAKTAPFWLLFVIFTLFSISFRGLTVHIVNHATDLGIETVAAAFLLTLIGAANTIGRILGGGASDRLGTKRSFIVGFLLQSLTCFWLIYANSISMLYPATFLYGLGYGTVGALFVKSVAEQFGVGAVGAISGILGLSVTVGGMVGPPLAGYIFDATASYSIAFLIYSVTLIAATAFCLLLQDHRQLNS